MESLNACGEDWHREGMDVRREVRGRAGGMVAAAGEKRGECKEDRNAEAHTVGFIVAPEEYGETSG